MRWWWWWSGDGGVVVVVVVGKRWGVFEGVTGSGVNKCVGEIRLWWGEVRHSHAQ